MADLDQWGKEVVGELHKMTNRLQEVEDSVKGNRRTSDNGSGNGIDSASMAAKVNELILSKVLGDNSNDKRDIPTANGTIKGIGLIGIIISVLVGLVAIGEYMGRENEYIRKDLVRAEEHSATLQKSVEELAKVQSGVLVTFREVATQFSGLREVVTLQQTFNQQQHDHMAMNLDELEEQDKWWNRNIASENSAQTVQIKDLKERIRVSEELFRKEYEAGRVQNRAGNIQPDLCKDINKH
jgi:hypothetical protein